ncbi:MAG: hypothetical protein QW074_06655 [Candidatus Caldarchaeum sp.]
MSVEELERERAREEFVADMLLPPIFMLTSMLSALVSALIIHPILPALGLYVAAIPIGIAASVTLVVRWVWRRRISARYRRST